MVEFALTAPILVAILVGIVELGILFSLYVGLSNSAREAARVGAIYRYGGATPGTGTLTTPAAVEAAIAPIDAGRAISMTETLSATLNPMVRVEALGLQVAYPIVASATNLYRAGETVSVTLTYSHTLLWGLAGDSDLVLRAQSAARIEPGGSR